jgi:alkanesulfonate monooxygenase SsuD/methylene tetrahydromethanopterin reductase-like flavin-dependent oxidoreductase (luciferase family)
MYHALEISGAGATADPRRMAELAHIAEDSGWDGVFLEDYIVHHSGLPTCDPWVALAAMATATRSVRLGTEVTPLSRRRPWKLARELVTLDHLSDGRVTLAVGLGDTNDRGFGAVGEATDVRTRAQLVDEALEIIDGLWTQERFSFSGRHYEVNDVSFQPRPIQQPRIPIWIGGGWPNRGVKNRALRWDGICAYIEMGTFEKWTDHSPEYVREVRGHVEQERGTADGYAIVTGGRTRDDDWERDRELIRALDAAGATWWVEYIDPEADLETHRQAVSRGPLR